MSRPTATCLSKKLHYLAAPELLSDDDLLLRVDGVNLENVFGDIQTDRGNLHGDGSLMWFVATITLPAMHCWERAPSTTSLLDPVHCIKIGPIRAPHRLARVELRALRSILRTSSLAARAAVSA